MSYSINENGYSPNIRYKGKILRIVEQPVKLPNGMKKIYEYAERSPGVRIIVSDRSKILLTKEWRFETHNSDFRLPGGKVFDSIDDYTHAAMNPGFNINHFCKIAAQKELKEETTLYYDLDSFEKIHLSKCGATIKWDLFYYLVEVPTQNIDRIKVETIEGEQIEVHWLSYHDVKELCFNGGIQEDRSVAVLLRYLHSHNHID